MSKSKICDLITSVNIPITIPYNDDFDSPDEKPFGNIVGIGENAKNWHFSLFPSMFSTMSKKTCTT